MDKDNKIIIPRKKYRRKRRQFFHNEEREQRIKYEQQLQQQQALKDEEVAKNNEERVKENLQKSRIEKLTQEEIQQQQQEMKKRNTSVETDAQTSPTANEDATTDDKTIEQETTEVQESSSPEATTLSKSTSNEATTDQNEDEHQSQLAADENTNFHSEEAQQSQVSDSVDADTTSNTTSDEQQSATQQATSKTEPTWQDKTRAFIKFHWAKILIVIGVILILTLMNAIFNNVDNNGHNKDGFLNGSIDDHKQYTNTMKSANKAIHSVVTVENNTSDDASSVQNETKEAGQENELGSGVVYKKVDDSIFIITNAHVVGDKEQQKITYGDDNETIGKVIGTDKWSDIAVVKAKIKKQSDIKAIKHGDSQKLVLGEPIIAVGNPLGVDFKGSISSGIISGLNRHVPVDIDKDDNYDVLMDAFQIDAPVNPGNSGGGIIDRDGKLVGIASLKISMDNVEGIAFAIPVNTALSTAQELEKKGEVKYPNTGVKIIDTAELNDDAKASLQLPEDIDNGVVIGEVQENSLAEKSGLQKNDVIVELDGKELEDKLRYRQIIFSHKDDLDTLPLKIYRDGKVKDIKLKLK
ncbi:trypsin-like peptidase domain-containing protein [Staphylococcus arlettae]|uniref:Serine protease HtrA-like n=1 Tax=Staphylococcus arlettae TaxID=29378 RepID=A0A380CJ99_9STAP|nr:MULTISPECIES: S1C family serine protease [Staphylococcus]EJY95560.1 serine protease [Staphylococcus arlettae CVD059]ERF49702.1 serine protease [Staphylococcus sp. EGD-HP3]MCD8815279.1 trypsin-like peptidase domain-containing protein [Staphylococcus arlettae]MCD8890121.1 trypsin-like peptidase domain-containing protein [Staphylococcus arlettae]MCD9054111.1 trypsin-like peptidase domain-containing protein [Staphylococcus arlettae]